MVLTNDALKRSLRMLLRKEQRKPRIPDKRKIIQLSKIAFLRHSVKNMVPFDLLKRTKNILGYLGNE